MKEWDNWAGSGLVLPKRRINTHRTQAFSLSLFLHPTNTQHTTHTLAREGGCTLHGEIPEGLGEGKEGLV